MRQPAFSGHADLTSSEKEWTQVDKTAAINKVNLLESELFDREEQVRRGVTNERAQQILDEINAWRRKLGWLDLDIRHQPVWPHNPARANRLLPAV